MTSTAKRQFIDAPLPASEDSERCILGAILIEERLISIVAELVSPADFYSPMYRKIFAAMLTLFEASKLIDPILIGEELKKEAGDLDSVGGISSITNLTYGLPMFTLRQAEQIREYAKNIASKKQLRDLLGVCSQIVASAGEGDADDQETITSAQAAVNDVCSRKTKGGFSPIDELANASIGKARALREGETIADGLVTGFLRLDYVTGGFQKSDLVIIAGRPGMGKSSLAGQLAVNACTATFGAVVAVFSLEMSKEQYTQRLLASVAEVDLNKLRTGNLNSDDLLRLDRAAERLGKLCIVIDDSSAINALEMRAKLLRLRHEKGRLDGVIIDFLQRMTTSKKTESRQNEVSMIARDLKSLAKDLSVPVVALSSLSRACETRHPPRPRMSDLRESGDIESEADLVAFVYRDNYYNPAADPILAELIIDKHRHGPTETMRLDFFREFAKFKNARTLSDAAY